MKIVFFLIVSLCVVYGNLIAQVSFNTDGSAADGSAMVDVKSTNKGLLIPRVALTATSSASPVTTPAASLLVYNTAATSDVTPGYYYWSGSKWERLSSTGSPEIIGVTEVTGDYSALKTDNLILAAGSSNNGIITLPAILSGIDDGLEITVKNVGTFTDLITIQPEGSSLIDGLTDYPITRWISVTFVAKTGNWFIKVGTENERNHMNVGANSSWTTLDEAFAYLNAHDPSAPASIHLEPGSYTISSTLTVNFSSAITIMGDTYGATVINCPSGTTAFNVQTECYFKLLSFAGSVAANTICINLSGTGEYSEIKDIDFTGFSKAVIITSSHDLWIFEVDMIDCASAAIEIASGSANVSFKCSETDFTNCAKGILFTSYGTATDVSILSSTFYNTAGQTGIVYVPSGSSPYFNSIIIQNNSFNNVGTFASGFDYTNARDANIFMENNAGVLTGRPFCKINLVNNATGTTITVGGTWYKANFTNTSNYTTKWTIANNKITYQSRNIRNGVAFISGNIRCSVANRTLNIALVKNGNSAVRFGETTARTTTANQSFQFSTNAYLSNISQNDYFEVWVTSTNAADVVTIDDLNWFTDTH
jgi:hypothetical protein